MVPPELSLRLAQVLIALPSMDSPGQSARWALSYGRLRALDWASMLVGGPDALERVVPRNDSNG